MTQTTLRPLKPEDLPDLLEMIEALAAHHGDQPLTTRQDLERDCLGPAPWLHVLIAEREGVIVGYTALCPLAQLQFGVRGMDMHHLFVRPGARGTGVGRSLIDGALRLSKDMGCRYVAVGTHPDNTVAAAVYRAIGFQDRPPPGPRFSIRI